MSQTSSVGTLVMLRHRERKSVPCHLITGQSRQMMIIMMMINNNNNINTGSIPIPIILNLQIIKLSDFLQNTFAL